MVRCACLLVALASCGAPGAYHCNTNADCGAVGQCTSQHYCAYADASCTSGLRYHESASDLANQCVGVEGAGIPGDKPSDPLPLGTTQTIDLGKAGDDITPSCGKSGGHDVFFETTLAARSRIYVDTFGSDFHVVVAMHPGKCVDSDAEAACEKDVCGPSFVQWTTVLDAGTYCVILDGDGTQTTSHLVVRSMIGPDSEMASLGTLTGDTCSADDWMGACVSGQRPDVTWFYMTCTQARVLFTTCDSSPGFSGDLQAWGLGKTPLGCGDGCPGIDVSVPPGPAWFVAEDRDVDCGTTDFDLKPN